MNVALLTGCDPLHAAGGPRPGRLAAQLAGQGHDVVLVLLEDAVLLARPGHREAPTLEAAIAGGVRVLAEEDALARRAVQRLGDDVKPAGFGEIVDLLMTWSDRQAWL